MRHLANTSHLNKEAYLRKTPKNGKSRAQSLFQKPYVVVRLRGRLYRNRSRYFAPVSRRSIN